MNRYPNYSYYPYNTYQHSSYQPYPYQPQQPYYYDHTKTTPNIMQWLDKLNLKGKDMNQTIQQLQQLAKLSQSITPLVQQYGPLIKNVPNMLSLLKQFQKQSSQTDLKRPEIPKLTENTQSQVENLYKIETFDIRDAADQTTPKLYV